MKEKTKILTRLAAIIGLAMLLHPGFFGSVTPVQTVANNNFASVALPPVSAGAIQVSTQPVAVASSPNSGPAFQTAPNFIQQAQNIIQNLQLSQILNQTTRQNNIAVAGSADQRTILVQIQSAPYQANLVALQYSNSQPQDQAAIASNFSLDFSNQENKNSPAIQYTKADFSANSNQIIVKQNNPENLSVWRC